MDIHDLQKLARDCIGVDRPSKDIDDWCNKLWGKPSSPSILEKTQDRAREIQEHLESLEENTRDTRRHRKLIYVPRNVSSGSTPERHGTRKKSASRKTHQYLSHIVIHKARPPCEIHTDEIHTDGPWALSDAAVSCFVKSNVHPNCKDCSRWKNAIARERRVHSLETLIAACSTKKNGFSTAKTGLIFFHSDDTSTVADTIKKIQGRGKDFRSKILMFACNSDKLTEENALYVL